MLRADLARLALDGIAKLAHREARLLRIGRGRVERHLGRGDHLDLAAGEARVAGLRRLRFRAFQKRPHSRR